MPIRSLPATIEAGQSLSTAVDCGDDFAVGLITPAEWTTAHVSVLISTDGIDFFDLFHLRVGTTSPIELKFNIVPGTIMAIDPDAMLMGRFLKLRSGEREKPIPQEAARIFSVITNTKLTVQARPLVETGP